MGLTLVNDNFNRADTTGQDWGGDWNVYCNQPVNDIKISSNVGTVDHISGGPYFFCSVNTSEITLPASLSFKINFSNASAGTDVGIWGSYDGVGGHGSTGARFDIANSGAELSTIVDGSIDQTTTYSFSTSTDYYVWIDYAPSGANLDVDVYINTSNSKPGSATLSTTGGTITKNKEATGFEGSGSVGGFSVDDFLLTDSTTFSPTVTYVYAIDKDGYIYKGISSSGLSGLEEKSQIDTTNWQDAEKLSIVQSPGGDVLWSSHQTGEPGVIGRAWTGKHDAGTSTTIMTDSSETFDSLVVAGDKIYNITDGSVGTVTSISGSTITCSGGLSGGTDNDWDSGDIYEVFASNFIELTENTVGSSPTGSDATSLSRQMVVFEDSTYVLNDNYLEAIATDYTYTAKFLQLHPGFIGECMAVNGNRLLIGANRSGLGKLHLWDGFNTDFVFKVDLPDTVKSIDAYREGWTVVCGRAIYYTDGVALRLMDKFPDIREQDDFNSHINGSCVKNENVYIVGGSSTNDKEKAKTGLWVYNPPRDAWSYFALPQDTGYSMTGATPGVVFNNPNANSIYCAYQTTEVTNPNFISALQEGNGSRHLALFTHNFNRDAKVQRVILELEPLHRYGDEVATKTLLVRAGFGKLDDIIWHHTTTRAAGSGDTNVPVTGSNGLRTAVDKGVLMLEGDSGFSFDFISSIANENTSTEALTMNNSLIATPEAGMALNIMPFYESEDSTQTISDSSTMGRLIFENIPEEAQYGRQFGALFYFNNTNFDFRITGVHLDYEDLIR